MVCQKHVKASGGAHKIVTCSQAETSVKLASVKAALEQCAHTSQRKAVDDLQASLDEHAKKAFKENDKSCVLCRRQYSKCIQYQ